MTDSTLEDTIESDKYTELCEKERHIWGLQQFIFAPTGNTKKGVEAMAAALDPGYKSSGSDAAF